MLRVWTFQRTHKVHKNLSYFIRTHYYCIIHLSNFCFARFKIVCSCWLVWINFHAIKFHHENAFSVLIKWPRLFIVLSNLAVDYANDRYRVIHISIYYLGRGILRKTFFSFSTIHHQQILQEYKYPLSYTTIRYILLQSLEIS